MVRNTFQRVFCLLAHCRARSSPSGIWEHHCIPSDFTVKFIYAASTLQATLPSRSILNLQVQLLIENNVTRIFSITVNFHTLGQEHRFRIWFSYLKRALQIPVPRQGDLTFSLSSSNCFARRFRFSSCNCIFFFCNQALKTISFSLLLSSSSSFFLSSSLGGRKSE